jgi:hypothetical protein
MGYDPFLYFCASVRLLFGVVFGVVFGFGVFFWFFVVWFCT